MDLASAAGENVGACLWKAFPFRNGNRLWLAIILQALSMNVIICFLLACVLNSVEGDTWLKSDVRDNGLTAKGDTALDECFWFVFTTVHGIGFGEFMPRDAKGRFISMFCCSLAYWFPIFLMSIVMLSQLPGEKMPTLGKVVVRVASAVWPSYVAFILAVCVIGSTAGPYVSSDYGYGWNTYDTGIYLMWQVAHRMPFGDLWPNTPYGRSITIVGAMLGNLYMPYALALIAVRRPTLAQHESLLQDLKSNPEDALGRGYIVPSATNTREVAMTELMPTGLAP
jgi:hypothetical protein